MKFKLIFSLLAVGVLSFIGIWTLDHAVQAQEKEDQEEAKAFLGVYLGEISDNTAERLDLPGTEGALITSVNPGSPADDFGLKRNDVIIAVDSTKIANSDDLATAIKSHKPGDEVEISLIRKGTFQTLKVKLGEQKGWVRFGDNRFILRSDKPNIVIGRAGDNRKLIELFSTYSRKWRLGIEHQNLNKQLGEYFGVEEGNGVLVSKVLEDSPAEKAGMLAGDIIISFAGKTIDNSNDLIKAINKVEKDNVNVEIVVFRRGSRISLNAELEKQDLEKHFFPRLDYKGSGIRIVRPDVRAYIHLPKIAENIIVPEIDAELQCIPEIIENIHIPEIHMNFDTLDFDWEHFGDCGTMHLYLSDGLDFSLKIDEDGKVTFNDKEFDSVKEFKEYTKSDEFQAIKREWKEKRKKKHEDRLEKQKKKIDALKEKQKKTLQERLNTIRARTSRTIV